MISFRGTVDQTSIFMNSFFVENIFTCYKLQKASVVIILQK